MTDTKLLILICKTIGTAVANLPSTFLIGYTVIIPENLQIVLSTQISIPLDESHPLTLLATSNVSPQIFIYLPNSKQNYCGLFYMG